MGTGWGPAPAGPLRSGGAPAATDAGDGLRRSAAAIGAATPAGEARRAVIVAGRSMTVPATRHSQNVVVQRPHAGAPRLDTVRARFTGPCFGVRDALAAVEAVLGDGDGRSVIALGSIVHNPQAQARLAGHGLSVERDPSRVPDGSRLVVTAHGAPPSVFEEAGRRGLEVVDTTCPLVRRVQEAAMAVRRAGRTLVVVGHGDHPEVRGVLGWAQGGHLVPTAEAAEEVPSGHHLGVVVQSTFPGSHLPPILDVLERRALSLEVHDTRCPVVTMRQRDGGRLVEQADVIVVVGGRSSANTRALAESCSARRPTYHVETPEEVRREWFSPGQRIGIASGTSTPDWLVDAVDELCRSF